MKKQLIQVPFGVSLHLRYLCQDEGLNGKQLLENIPSFQKPRFISMVENLTGQKRFPQM